MSSVNKVILIGRLGADPEVKYTQGGQPVANLRVATDEVWNDRDGKRQERTEWHNVTVWGKQAEHCGQYLAKGRQVYIEGRLQSREYEKDGQKHRAWDVVASHVTFLGGGAGDGGGASSGGGSNRNEPSRDSGTGWNGNRGSNTQRGGGEERMPRPKWGGDQPPRRQYDKPVDRPDMDEDPIPF